MIYQTYFIRQVSNFILLFLDIKEKKNNRKKNNYNNSNKT